MQIYTGRNQGEPRDVKQKKRVVLELIQNFNLMNEF